MVGPGRPALFLDRDGTIIEDRHYLADPAGVKLLPGAAAGISRFNRADWPVVVVSNQSGIGRGLIRADQYDAVTARMIELLGERDARVTALYHCPHDPDTRPECGCRKPAPGLFVKAASEHGLDLTKSRFVGDRLRDLEPGVALGGTGYLLRHGERPVDATAASKVWVVDSIQEVAELVLGPEG